MLLLTANGMIDAVFVGRLGTAALSGVGLASQIMLVLMSLVMAVSVGTTALVARFVGAAQIKDAEQAVRQSILLGVIGSVLSGLFVFLVGPTLMRIMGGRGEGLTLGITYLNIVLLGAVPFYLLFVLNGVFRGFGDMRTPLMVTAVVTVVSIVGDYLLIFGIGPFPRLGVVGAGIANVTARSVGAVMLLACLARSPMAQSLRGSWRPIGSWFRRILNIGSPAALQALLRTGASMVYFAILGLTPQGQSAIAALTIGIRTEALAFMPGFAFSTAATSMVGQNLGARQPKRAIDSAWAATWQGIWITGAFGLIFFVFASPISSLFTKDPSVLPLAASYLRINAISEPFLAMAMIFTGALQGAGATRMPAMATIATMWVVRLPLSYYLALVLGYGTVGAWVAMAGSTILAGLIMLGVFKWSRWKETEV